MLCMHCQCKSTPRPRRPALFYVNPMPLLDDLSVEFSESSFSHSLVGYCASCTISRTQKDNQSLDCCYIGVVQSLHLHDAKLNPAIHKPTGTSFNTVGLNVNDGLSNILCASFSVQTLVHSPVITTSMQRNGDEFQDAQEARNMRKHLSHVIYCHFIFHTSVRWGGIVLLRCPVSRLDTKCRTRPTTRILNPMPTCSGTM